MTIPYKKIHIVINPAAGQDEPILNVLNDIFTPAGVDWEISLTKKSGDATRFAAEAAASGVDLIAAYGVMAPKWKLLMACWAPVFLRRSYLVELAMPWLMS